MNIPTYAKASGKGVKALDNDDSTVTENSDIPDFDQKKYDKLNPIYSTEMDKQNDLSEGEIDLRRPNAQGYNLIDENYSSNYESDQFEDADMDDDFNLPAEHKQNKDPVSKTNIKQSMLFNQASTDQNKHFTNGSSQTQKQSSPGKKPVKESS